VKRSIEEPRGKPRGIFDRKEFCLILIRSLTPQQERRMRSLLRFKFTIAAGNPHIEIN
jgi:hypothetical protein